MAIDMPDETRLPPGPRRDLVAAVHELYLDAGRPGTRATARAILRRTDLPCSVSHETIAALLHGRSIPDWRRLHAVVRHLADESVHRPDPEAEVLRVHALWRTLQVVTDGRRAADRADDAGVGTVRDLIAACWPAAYGPELERFLAEDFDVHPDDETTRARTVVVVRAWVDLLLDDRRRREAELADLRRALAERAPGPDPVVDVSASRSPSPAPEGRPGRDRGPW